MTTWKPSWHGLGTVLIAVLALLTTSAKANDLGMSFEKAAFLSCRDVQAMPSEQRTRFALALVERTTAHFNVAYTQGTPLDDEIATLIRSGCTVFPGAYLHNIVTMAVRRAANVPPQAPPTDETIPFESAAFLTCQQYALMTAAQQDALEFQLAVAAGNHYGYRFDDSASGRAKVDQGVSPLVHGTCRLLPDTSIYAVVGRAVAAAAAKD